MKGRCVDRHSSSNENLPSLTECYSSPAIVRQKYLSRDVSRARRRTLLSGGNTLVQRPQLPPLALGTPVLALWRREYYPAIVIDYAPSRKQFRVKYCDDVMRWLPRKSIAASTDANFASVPLADLELIEGLTTEASQLGREASRGTLQEAVEKSYDRLFEIACGGRPSERRDAFFASQRSRSHLAHSINRGALSFHDFFILTDIVAKKCEPMLQDERVCGFFAKEAHIDDLRDPSVKLLINQAIHMVLLPELISLCDDLATPGERRLMGEGPNTKDYVTFLLSRREMSRLAMNKQGLGLYLICPGPSCEPIRIRMLGPEYSSLIGLRADIATQ